MAKLIKLPTLILSLIISFGVKGQDTSKMMKDIYVMQNMMVPDLKVPGDTIPMNVTTQALMIQLERYRRCVETLDKIITLLFREISIYESMKRP